VHEALLKDAESVQTPSTQALADARAESVRFNDRFTRGKMGQVLGYSERSRRSALPEDTLSRVIAGREQARDLEQMIAAAPESRQDAIDYLTSQFAMTVTQNGKVDAGRANRYISQLRKNRVFEILPELEDQLTNAASKAGRAALLERRAKIVREQGGLRWERGGKKALATMYAEADIDREAGIVLDVSGVGGSNKIRNPVQAAARLFTKMRGDAAAEEGLRQSFRNAIWQRAKSGLDAGGFDEQSARVFTRLVRDNEQVMRQLGFSDDDLLRMRKLATVMRQAEFEPRQSGANMLPMSDVPGIVLNSVFRVAGARLGSWVNRLSGGSGAGPGLQAAQLGAAKASQISSALRVDPAEQILLDALDNPQLFTSLLLGDQSSVAARRAAASKLNAWAIGAGLTTEEELKAEGKPYDQNGGTNALRDRLEELRR
jgi:hypothetical protein